MSSDDIADVCGGKPVHTTEEQRERDFAPMPVAFYPMLIEKAELKSTERTKYVWVQFSVIGEQFNNRKVFGRYTIWHVDAEKSQGPAKAVEIGRRELAHLGQAVGLVTGVRKAVELLAKKLDVKVKIRPARDDNGTHYEAENEPTMYAPLGTKAQGNVAKGPATPSAKPQETRAWDQPAASPPTGGSAQPAAPPASTTSAPATAAPATSPNPTPPSTTTKAAKLPWET